MLWTARRLTLILFAGYVGICLLVWTFQARLVWFPGPEPRSTPADLGWAFETVALRSGDGVELAAWYLPVGGAPGAVLISHGNAGSIENRLHLAEAFRAMGLSVLLYDYRGYGSSQGRPSERGTYLDSRAALDHLTGVRGFSPGQIVLYGESLGGAVAVELAVGRPPAALVIESSFTSLPDVGAEVYPWLPVRLLSRIRYGSIELMDELRSPLLVIHSTEDELIPFAHAERLYQRASGPKRLLRTDGGHKGGGFTRRAEWRREVEEFVLRALE